VELLDGILAVVSDQPSGGSELGDPIDREVCRARQDRAKNVANRDSKWPTAAMELIHLWHDQNRALIFGIDFDRLEKLSSGMRLIWSSA